MKVLEFNILQTKLENPLKIKILKQKFLEYKHTIQQCVDTFFIGFIDFVLTSRSLLQYTNSFFPNEYKKNDKIILNYIQ